MLSKKADYRHKLGAVVVYKNRPVGFGFNKPYKTHPMSTNKYNTVHAELDAIIGIPYKYLINSSIYVYRETKTGKPACSKPCQHCMELIKRVGIKKIFYTDNGFYKEENIN